MFKARMFSLFLLLLLPLIVFSGMPQSGYRVTQKVVLGGEGGWDYLTVDPQNRRLYVSRGTHVMVVDADSLKVVGDIPNTNGVHGIAVVPELGKGFTSNGRDSSVSVFDLKTLKVLSQIPVGRNPDSITYDSAAKRVFTFNGQSRDATAIDPAAEKVTDTIALDGRPETGVADDKGHVFVNIEDKSLVALIDTKKMAVEARWALDPGTEPSGLAIDRKSHRLFVGCANRLMVVMN